MGCQGICGSVFLPLVEHIINLDPDNKARAVLSHVAIICTSRNHKCSCTNKFPHFNYTIRVTVFTSLTGRYLQYIICSRHSSICIFNCMCVSSQNEVATCTTDAWLWYYHKLLCLPIIIFNL